MYYLSFAERLGEMVPPNPIFKNWKTANEDIPKIINKSFKIKVMSLYSGQVNISLVTLTDDDCKLIPPEYLLQFKSIIDTFGIEIFDKIGLDLHRHAYEIISDDLLSRLTHDITKAFYYYKVSSGTSVKLELIRSMGVEYMDPFILNNIMDGDI